MPGLAAHRGPRDIIVGTAIAPRFLIGCIASGGGDAWVLANPGGFMKFAYPANQKWGFVYITLVDIRTGYSAEQTCDFSSYRFLNLEIKGECGGEEFYVGVRSVTDPKSGQPPKYKVANVTTDWQTVSVPLAALIRPREYPESRFGQLHAPCELYFSGARAQTVFVRSICYSWSALDS